MLKHYMCRVDAAACTAPSSCERGVLRCFFIVIQDVKRFVDCHTAGRYITLNDMILSTIVDGVAQAYMRADFRTAAPSATAKIRRRRGQAGGVAAAEQQQQQQQQSPVVLLVGAKKPRVPLLLSRVVSKLDRIHKDVFKSQGTKVRGPSIRLHALRCCCHRVCIGSLLSKQSSQTHAFLLLLLFLPLFLSCCQFQIVNAKRDCLARGAAIFAYLQRQLQQSQEAAAAARRQANVARQLSNNTSAGGGGAVRPRGIRHLQSLDDEVVTVRPSSRRQVQQASAPTQRHKKKTDDKLLRWAKALAAVPTCETD